MFGASVAALALTNLSKDIGGGWGGRVGVKVSNQERGEDARADERQCLSMDD